MVAIARFRRQSLQLSVQAFQERGMSWSLSEFLNLIELRGQTWCFAELGSATGFSVPHSEEIYFYALLEGRAHVAGLSGESIELRAGDAIMILSGDAHAVRNRSKSMTASLDFLTSGDYADAPPTLRLGKGSPVTRLLAGRLKVRWPGGQRLRSIPAVLTARAKDILNYAWLLDRASGSGAMAILTRAATLLFVSALRDHPQSRVAFLEFDQHDPVLRAQQCMEIHPFDRWTVEILAHKVGLGRSSLATLFARKVGRTPMEFLTEERMKHGALFLEKTNMKVIEIAARVGYRSQAAFIRRFAVRFGMTPGELRRRSRRTLHRSTEQYPISIDRPSA
jgi:AraC-like DNA-binding protein/mannose-6-phosphate isomerase-like protein (cupin superfamily)